MSTSISFATYNLQTTADKDATIISSNIIYRHLADRILNIREDSLRDDFKIVDSKYSRKIITVSGFLIATTVAKLRTLVDNFKKGLRLKEQNLDINDGSGVLRWTATTQTIMVEEEGWMTTQIPFTIEFLCSPYATATSSESEPFNNITTTPYEDTITITKGSYRPKAKISFHVDNTTLTLIRFENDTTSDWIQVETSFSAGDDLVIDCDAETVELNDVAQDFSGVFPMLEMGANDFKVIQTGTKGIDLTIEWWPRFL